MNLTPAERAVMHLFADRYPDHASARRLLDTAGIPQRFVAFTDRPVDTWFAIVAEAKHRSAVPRLIDAALADYPADPLLLEARAGDLLPPVEHGSLDRYADAVPSAALVHAEIMKDASELLPVSFLARGAVLARAVAMIETPRGVATGFLIPDNRLVTNSHVIPSVEVARAARIVFGYDQRTDDATDRIRAVRLAPERFFANSPEREQDWTVVAVDGDPQDEFGCIQLETDRQEVSGYLTLVHHPFGAPKQLSLRHNAVVHSSDEVLHYLTGTADGSSGAPVFDGSWRLVAVHRGSTYQRIKTAGGKARHHNVGTRITAVADQIG